MVQYNGKKVFCFSCADFDLEIIEDEMLGKMCDQPDFEMLRCNNIRCGAYWSLNYVEKHENEFTDERIRRKIISDRIKTFEAFKKRRLESELKVIEVKSKRKRKRKSIETSDERPITSF